MTKKNATPIYGKNLSNIFSRNSWPIAMEFDLSQTVRAHHSLFNLWPWVDLDLFHAKVEFGRLVLIMGKMKIIYFSKSIAAFDAHVGHLVQCIYQSN